MKDSREKRTPAFQLTQVIHLILAVFFALYIPTAFAAPILAHAKKEKAANAIYTVYSVFCHQRAERSIFLFGEKPFYSLSELRKDEYTGTFRGTDFVGNPELGYKVAVCSRCVGLYGFFGLTALLSFFFPQIFNYRNPFSSKRKQRPKDYTKKQILQENPQNAILRFLRHRWPPILALILIAPMAFDGGVQLIAELVPTVQPFYVSNNIRRILTGALAGAGFGYLIFSAFGDIEED